MRKCHPEFPLTSFSTSFTLRGKKEEAQTKTMPWKKEERTCEENSRNSRRRISQVWKMTALLWKNAFLRMPALLYVRNIFPLGSKGGGNKSRIPTRRHSSLFPLYISSCSMIRPASSCPTGHCYLSTFGLSNACHDEETSKSTEPFPWCLRFWTGRERLCRKDYQTRWMKATVFTYMYL